MSKIRLVEKVIMFCDIHNFSKIMIFHENIYARFIQSYYTMVGDIVVKAGGKIINYLGDAVLIVFNKDAELKAINCAREMRSGYANILNKFNIKEKSELEIGINSGMVSYGTFGHKSHEMMDIFGNCVNEAAMIMHYRGIAVTDNVYKKVKPDIEVKPLPMKKVKWQKEGIKVWAVREMPSKQNPALKQICPWAATDPLLTEYHNKEWGVPVHNDRKIFEFLVLESFQAGLSWLTVLRKRENFRKAFDNFDFVKIAQHDARKINTLLKDPGIIRNRLKINAAIENAKSFIKVRKEFGTFDKYIWSFTNGKTINNKFTSLSQIPAKTDLSDAISRDLKNRGFKFLGSTVIYAHLQAMGIVNDHILSCFRYKEIVKNEKKEYK